MMVIHGPVFCFSQYIVFLYCHAGTGIAVVLSQHLPNMFVTLIGTMGNLIALGCHCSGRGEEVICGKDSHIFVYEQGGASSLMGIVLNTIQNQADGTLDLDEVAKFIKPNDPHFAVAKVLALENTSNKLGGLILPLDYMKKAGVFCQHHGLKMHVDGARLWNAAVALSVPMADLVKEADSVNVCLSKGLGAPVGSVLTGAPVGKIQGVGSDHCSWKNYYILYSRSLLVSGAGVIRILLAPKLAVFIL